MCVNFGSHMTHAVCELWKSHDSCMQCVGKSCRAVPDTQCCCLSYLHPIGYTVEPPNKGHIGDNILIHLFCPSALHIGGCKCL